MKHALVLSLALVAASACDCGAKRRAASPPRHEVQTPTPATVEAPAPAEAAPETPPPPPPGPRVERPEYLLTATTVGRYAMSRRGKLRVELATTNGYTLHDAFPLRVVLRAPGGVGMAKTVYERADATSATPTRAQLDVTFTPTQRGEANIDAVVTFAVCQGTACEPREERLLLGVTIE